MRYIHFISLVVLLLSSCYTEMDLNGNSYVVVNSFVASDSLIKVDLLKTTPVNELSQKVYITDATIKLFEDEKYIEDLILIDSIYELRGSVYNSYYYLSKTTAKIGHKYRIEIKTSEADQISAETIIPVPVSILSIDTIFDYTIKKDENTIEKKEIFKIRFEDPNGSNYYRITVRKRYGHDFGNNIIKIIERNGILNFYKIDTIFSYFNEDEENELFNAAENNFLIFNDKKIENQEYELKLSRKNVESYYGTSIGDFTQYIFELHSLTYEGYNYLRTVDIQGQIRSVEEPVLSYTNVKNGIGIFTGYSAFQKIITIGKYPVEGLKYEY